MALIISICDKGTLYAICTDNEKMKKTIDETEGKYPEMDWTRTRNKDNFTQYKRTLEPIINDNFQGIIYKVGSHPLTGIHSEPNKTVSKINDGNNYFITININSI